MINDPIPSFQEPAPDPGLRAMFPNSPQMFEAAPEAAPDPLAARMFPHTPQPQPQQQPAEGAAPAIPDAYRGLVPPDGYALDPAGFAPVAKELGRLGVSREQAQGLLGLHAKLEAQQDAAVAAENARWRQEAEKALQPGDREAIAAVMAGAPAEVRQLLGRTGLGNHPALVRWIAGIGRQVSGRRS